MEKSKSRAKLLRRIQECSLYVSDLAEYLDTHPECRHGIAAYNRHNDELAALIEEYERDYGMLKRGKIAGDKWEWISNPWPWDNSLNENED